MNIIRPEPVKTYTDASEFYEDPNKDLVKNLDNLEKNSDYISWIQSFSKKIVSITFLLYLGVNIFTLYVTYMNAKAGNGDTTSIYTEMNETFRVVIGGYLIKAGLENAFKISGNFMVGVSDAKLKALKERLGFAIQSQEDLPVDEEEYSGRYDDDEI